MLIWTLGWKVSSGFTRLFDGAYENESFWKVFMLFECNRVKKNENYENKIKVQKFNFF